MAVVPPEHPVVSRAVHPDDGKDLAVPVGLAPAMARDHDPIAWRCVHDELLSLTPSGSSIPACRTRAQGPESETPSDASVLAATVNGRGSWREPRRFMIRSSARVTFVWVPQLRLVRSEVGEHFDQLSDVVFVVVEVDCEPKVPIPSCADDPLLLE